jgi:malate dehydrogenase
MFDVAIIGGGELGGAIAHRLAVRDVAAAVRLIDESGTVATGKALDIMQAAPIERFSTRVSGTADVAMASGASVVVVADRAAGGEWRDEDGLALLRRLFDLTPSLVVCAGANQREMIERAARELRVPRLRMFGSAPEALASAIRAIVALEANTSPRDVSVTVLGIPPARVVVPWEDAAIGGFSATRLLDGPARRRVEARIARLWPPGPIALAAAAVSAIDIIAGRSRRTVSGFLAPDDAAGRRMRAAAVPLRLGPQGVEEAEVPALTPHDRVALDTAILL